LELCTLGTIADLAPLQGVNRRWLRRGLALLPQSKYVGIQSLIAVSGSQTAAKTSLKPEAIGFRLGPRINAIGRIGDPQTVIELLTTDDLDTATACAQVCEQANQTRQQLCSQIEQEAIEWIEASDLDLQAERVLVVVQPGWHHGVIGIVASRLVERYGVPVFIGTTEDEAGEEIRGSARGIPEFDVFAALQACGDLFHRFGGHRAAGGFSFAAANLPAIQARLSQFACQCLEPGQLLPLVTADAIANFDELNWEFYQELDQLQPCGMGNPLPVFCSQDVVVLDQRVMGADGNHLKLTLGQSLPGYRLPVQFKATAWRWGAYFPLPPKLDIAYQLVENTWNGETNIELNLLGARLPQANCVEPTPVPHPSMAGEPSSVPPSVPALAPDPVTSPPASSQPLTVSWICPDPPASPADAIRPDWLPLENIEQLLPELAGNLLLYGYGRPELLVTNPDSTLEYDRPTQVCDTLLLWTLPPSWTHLRWLIARAQPSQIYVRNHCPDLPVASALKQHLLDQLQTAPEQPLNLLALGQQFWVAPCTLIAALRELGHPCTEFPATCSLTQELQRLERWYLYPPQALASIG
jgi:single-stranded-DNA-specific exonuclease